MTLAKKTRTISKNKLEDDVVRLGELKAKQDIIATEAAQVQERILAALDQRETTNIRVERAGEVFEATLVAPERVVIDEPALAKKLGATVWRKVSTAVLDKSKLASAIKDGDVNELDIAAVTTINKTRRYIKLTRK